ncbi:SNF1-interacting protein [Elasticomyces elasticus]|nr:SNF1-interacting protein [Elasticomyces elasticus]KAK3642834.1 SNF1-interacting protein [Elasticomyces elasticus]KAK4920708.1 SNF1-interacting protein [Elasticomyces elasticus]KAK5754122.1 SNF1-interacting protein [Elasticomyces elasticus]
MGNSSSKDERRPSRPESSRHASSSSAAAAAATQQPVPPPQTPADRFATHMYTVRNGAARGSRPDLSFLTMGRDRSDDGSASERPRETKQEKEVRKADKERQVRAKEREKSMRDEGVDGGYLVTLGVYTGTEDFDKAIVRKLQIERRLAPFWKGLNDHSDSWTEAQLVAAARDLPIPAADEVPTHMARTGSQASNDPRSSDHNLDSLMVPMSSRSQSYQSDASANLSASHPAFSGSGPASMPAATSSAALLRGRAKTLASLATGMKGQADITPREVQLPKDPSVNGLPIEAYLYREAIECPICFMYYPPYLNHTRCCDQSICSECFVQIKRPDPHPPEHEQPGQPKAPEEEANQLVSEIASCPFCVTPEFGVTYEPPPFRRGLAYANQPNGRQLASLSSAMSSSSSLASGPGRRRATSLSASSSNVVTTDSVRPDWAKKLADARAHVMRRSAAATALHNAAYVLGNGGEPQIRAGMTFGRRRRTLFGDSPSASGSGTPHEEGNTDLFPGRSGSRRNRVDDLEDLMMMEAIRLSLAAEEDRARREDKEMRKEDKKKAKEDKKQAKQAEKLAKKRSASGTSLYTASTNDSTSSWAAASMARSTSNLGAQPSIPEEQFQGKGKAPVQDFAGFNPLTDPSSTLNTEMQSHDRSGSPSTNPIGDPQGHLEVSRAALQPPGSSPIPTPRSGSHLRQISNASSTESSFVDSPSNSLPTERGNLDITPGSQEGDTPPAGSTPSTEPMFNFRSLAAMVGKEEDKGRESEHIEHAGEPGTRAEEELKEPSSSPTGSLRLPPSTSVEGYNRSRGDSGESSSSAPPPIYVEHPPTPGVDGVDQITPAPVRLVHDVDKKDYGDVHVLNHADVREATQ